MPAVKEYVKIRGLSGYGRLGQPDEYGKYKQQIYPNEAGMELFKSLKNRGLMNQLKRDEKGDYTNFGRDHSKTWTSGETTVFGPPKVIGPDGEPINEFIGLGSDIEMKLEVYPFKRKTGGGMAIAARLDTILVHKLVPYVKKQTEGQPEARPQVAF